MAKSELDNLWTKVTGLTWSVEAVIQNINSNENLTAEEKTAVIAKLAWNIPDGIMLMDNSQKAKDTAALMEALGLEPESKLDYDVESDDEDSSSYLDKDNG